MRIILALLVSLLCLGPALAKPVTLHYDHAELGFVLKKLAPALGKNIYLSPEVKGEVTMDVQKMDAMKAFKLILQMQDAQLGYKIVGNTIVVASPERLSTIPDDLFKP